MVTWICSLKINPGSFGIAPGSCQIPVNQGQFWNLLMLTYFKDWGINVFKSCDYKFGWWFFGNGKSWWWKRNIQKQITLCNLYEWVWFPWFFSLLHCGIWWENNVANFCDRLIFTLHAFKLWIIGSMVWFRDFIFKWCVIQWWCTKKSWFQLTVQTFWIHEEITYIATGYTLLCKLNYGYHN